MAGVIQGLPLPQKIVVYGGHRIYAASGVEQVLANQMDQLLELQRVVLGLGSLACGADILWAEALERRGAELHLFIPGTDEQFVNESVSPGGLSWIPRFEKMLGAASCVTRLALDDGWADVFRRTSDAAFADAISEARIRNGQVALVELWDGSTEAGEDAGTAADIARWENLGLPVYVISSLGRRISRLG